MVLANIQDVVWVQVDSRQVFAGIVDMDLRQSVNGSRDMCFCEIKHTLLQGQQLPRDDGADDAVQGKTRRLLEHHRHAKTDEIHDDGLVTALSFAALGIDRGGSKFGG